MELLVLSSLFLGETLWYDSGSQVPDIAKHFAWRVWRSNLPSDGVKYGVLDAEGGIARIAN